jgi:hypothetical protein
MRADEATLLTYQHLDALDLRDWKVRCVPFIPRDEDDERNNCDSYGLCCYADKVIVLSARYCLPNDYSARALVQHEVAHALLGPSSNEHGSDFQAALARVRSMNLRLFS